MASITPRISLDGILLGLRKLEYAFTLNPICNPYAVQSDMEFHRQKGLTPKERALVRNLANGKNLTQSALAAGYSRKCPGQSGWQALQNIRLKLPDLLDKHGLTDNALIEKHLKPLLGATETMFFQSKGNVTETRRVPAHRVRINALDMAFRLKGSYKAPADEPGESEFVQVIVQAPQTQNGPQTADLEASTPNMRKDILDAAKRLLP
jgi:hypothetical protein